MAENVIEKDANVSQSEEDDKEMMSMFASVWVKVEVGGDESPEIVKKREEKLKELKKELKRKRNCERQRAYYHRQKNLKKNEEKKKKKSISKRKVPKTNAERQREFRQRKAEKSYVDIPVRKSRRKQKKAQKILFCDLCDYTTVYKNCLELHIIGHTNAKPYSCQSCDYSAKYPVSLSRHIMIKHPKDVLEQSDLPVYKCNQCDYTAHFKWNLNSHKRKHQLEKQFQCPHCPYSTAYRHNFSKHSKVHSQGVVFKCDKCPFITKFEGHITRHLAKIHNEVIDKAYKCDFCDFATKIRWRLNIHKQRSKQENTLKCALCEFETIYMCESKKHKVTHYSKIYGSGLAPQGENRTSMNNQNEEINPSLNNQSEHSLGLKNRAVPQEEECSPSVPQTYLNTETAESTEELHEKSNNQYRLDSDCVDWNSIQVLESEDKERPFLCHMCNYTSKFKAAVQRHFQRHHTGSKNRPYKCCNCDFSTKTKDQIALHNKRSKSNTVLFCKTCDFTTKFKCQFVMHQKCHYAFKCSVCSYSCRQKYELQKHYTNLHLGDGLKCSYCDYKAARKESLLCHETIHTGVKPFKCNQCSYTSVRKSLLDNHVKRYHSTVSKGVTIVTDSKIESLKVTLPMLEQLEAQYKNCPNITENVNCLQ